MGDVKVDGNPTVCNTLPNTDKPSRPHTHTPPEEDKPDLASIRDPHKSTSPRSTPPSDTETMKDKTTTSSETPGDQTGEIKVTSRSPPLKEPPVSAVSNKPPSGQT